MSNLPQDYENILNLASSAHPMVDTYTNFGCFNIMSRNRLLTEYITTYSRILVDNVVYYPISNCYMDRGCHIVLYCSTSLNYIVRVTDGSIEHTIKGPYSV